jgi:hypothetical protein
LSACAADALPVESEFTRTEAILVVDDEESFRPAAARADRDRAHALLRVLRRDVPVLKRAMPAIGLTTGFVLVLWLVRGDISEEEPRLRGKTQPLALPRLRFRFWF